MFLFENLLVYIYRELTILGISIASAIAIFLFLFWIIPIIIGSKEKHNDPFVKYLSKPVLAILIVISIRVAVPYFDLSVDANEFIRTLISICLIFLVCWAILQSIHVLDDFVAKSFDLNDAENLSVKKVYTQMSFLKRVILILVFTIGLGSTLMSFEKVRQVGTSLLASAGIIGVIVGVASQKTIANFIAGLQIALTQPIRLNDVVIVEGEWGKIEEITLTYVVIRIWDMRRLIVPVTYFFEKPFQNWTRVNSEILGTVFLYVDYSVSVDSVREEFYKIVENSPIWNRKVRTLQVTDATPNTIILRALVSVSDGSKAWDLRCEIREKLIKFLQTNYPQALPRVRIEIPKDGQKLDFGNLGNSGNSIS